MWPGPTFDVRKGQPLTVKWANHLPKKHFLPLDYSIHGAGQDVPQVRTVTHVHGARVMPDSDGYPDAWVTSDGRFGSVRAADPCHYPNDQSATTLWYHDHALGITRLNVYAGLAGFYLIRDAEEDSLNLPARRLRDSSDDPGPQLQPRMDRCYILRPETAPIPRGCRSFSATSFASMAKPRRFLRWSRANIVSAWSTAPTRGSII